jgi:hypothetical protein
MIYFLSIVFSMLLWLPSTAYAATYYVAAKGNRHRKAQREDAFLFCSSNVIAWGGCR